MTAGQNTRSRIWRMTQKTDDIVGGAVYSGTAYYPDVLTRFQAMPEEELLLQQGIETERIFSVIVVPALLVIKERDELEVTKPLDHVYYGKRFRIVSVSYSDNNPRDPRGYIMLKMTRVVRSRTEQ